MSIRATLISDLQEEYDRIQVRGNYGIAESTHCLWILGEFIHTVKEIEYLFELATTFVLQPIVRTAILEHLEVYEFGLEQFTPHSKRYHNDWLYRPYAAEYIRTLLKDLRSEAKTL